MSERTDYIAEAIIEAFGDRCPDYAPGCACCEAWRQYDELWNEAYLAGFNASGEGWNGEYPFADQNRSPASSIEWVSGRDRASPTSQHERVAQ